MSHSFPVDHYTPFGYIDNPYHSAIENPSGVFRTVPPLGMGYWCRNLPFPYGNGFGLCRRLNYLSFLMPGFIIDGTPFLSEQDFSNVSVELFSDYHTSRVLSLCFEHMGTKVQIRYVLNGEDRLMCRINVFSGKNQKVRVILRHLYGYPEKRIWGSDGYNGRISGKQNWLITKGFAYGDVFALGADISASDGIVTDNSNDMDLFLRNQKDIHQIAASSISPEPIYGALVYEKDLHEAEDLKMNVGLIRHHNEAWAKESLQDALDSADKAFLRAYEADDAFYKQCPQLEGDWPEEWRRGFVYHFETVRMTIRPPRGIYKHPWDGMQIHTPRQVLGETAIDCMLLSYADPALAKEVILGTFQDAIAPHVPCTREDGSMNMISQEGEECATSPIWVMPFPTIRSIYSRTGDKEWLAELYPYLVKYIDWWLENRADAEGFLHVACSWEAQDGSKRFNVKFDEKKTVGSDVSSVRTSDLQAAVTNALRDIRDYASILDYQQDLDHFDQLYKKLYSQCQSMYYEGRFRDFDGATKTPIIIDNYFDIMMLTPYAVGVTTEEQNQDSRALFQYFIDHPIHWLEWPSFLYIYTEAARKSGNRDIAARSVLNAALREYPKLDMRTRRSTMCENYVNLPDEFFYRIPGVGNEFWAIRENNPGGCENYGWGSTLPTLIIRNIIGYTESDEGFSISPCILPELWKPGKEYRIVNLYYRSCNFDVTIRCLDKQQLYLEIHFRQCEEVLINGKQADPLTELTINNDDSVFFSVLSSKSR